MLKPWVHYIPVHATMVDFNEKLAWALKNDAECQKIASNGRQFAQMLTYDFAATNYTIVDSYKAFANDLFG